VKSFETFAKDVDQVHDSYNRNYLYAEYNHAVHASQMAVKWHDFEADGDNYDLQYRTAGDDRVREEHAALHNTTLPPSDPFWTKYLPPNGWNCRCTAVQVRKEKYPRTDSAKATALGDEMTAEPKQQIFRFNPGKTLEVFPPKHPYYKAPETAKGQINRIAGEAADWRQKAAMPPKEAGTEVKKWFNENLPNRTILSEALKTGELRLNSNGIKNFLGHARNSEAKWILTTLADNADALNFIDYRKLGETKDMSDPVQAKNVAEKAKRNVVGYNAYEYLYNGKQWLIGIEKVQKGDNKAFEQPYFIKEIKEKP